MAFSLCSDLYFVQPVLSGHLAFPKGDHLIQLRLYLPKTMNNKGGGLGVRIHKSHYLS